MVPKNPRDFSKFEQSWCVTNPEAATNVPVGVSHFEVAQIHGLHMRARASNIRAT
jgi:hypothetical protein